MTLVENTSSDGGVVYIMNNRGPGTEPRGTPDVTTVAAECPVGVTIVARRPDK